MDRVVHVGPAASGGLESHSDLDPLDRLHRHDGLGQPPVELAVPLGVGAEPDRQAVDTHLDHATPRIPFLADAIDQFGDFGIAIRMERVDDTAFADGAKFRRRSRAAAQRDATELGDPADHLDAEGLPSSPSTFQVGLALGAYGLTQALFQLPFGMLSDRYGRKNIIYVGLLLFALGSFVSGYSDDIHIIILGRAIQGAGAISAAITALVADLTRDEALNAMSKIQVRNLV